MASLFMYVLCQGHFRMMQSHAIFYQRSTERAAAQSIMVIPIRNFRSITQQSHAT